jgi:hypothetical protein
MQRPSLLLPLLLLAHAATAQNLRLTLQDGNTHIHPVSTIRSITFAGGNMQLNLLAGTTLAWPIATVRSYAFDLLTTGVGEHTVWGGLQLFPNPASEEVTIRFEQQSASRATVEIVDISGRTVAKLFDGEAPAGSTRLVWDVREQGAARAGLYFCRISTSNGMLTAPIMIE